MPLGLGLHANFALLLIVAAFSLPALAALLPCAADPIKIGLRVATLAAMAKFCSPTGAVEL
jgi:hypothetical protein